LNIYKIIKICSAIWFSIVIIQWILWWGYQDDIATILTILGAIISTTYFLRKKIILRYPISALMMLGYTSYYFILPPIATFVEGKSLSNNLIHPSLVLIHAFICLLILIFTHYVYSISRILQKIRWFIANKVLEPLSGFKEPSNLQITLIGIIGLVALLVQIFVIGIFQKDAQGLVSKILQGLSPLAFLPYIILVRKMFGRLKQNITRDVVILFFYTILIILVSLGKNSRYFLFEGITSIVIAYCYGLLMGFYSIKKVGLWKIILSIVVILIIAKPFTDLSQSMVAVRHKREELSGLELVSESITAFRDKKLLNSQNIKRTYRESYWTEYLDNIYFQRLCNLQFADTSIDMAQKMGDNAKKFVRNIEFQKMVSFLPSPIIRSLGIQIDKNLAVSSSSGDFMVFAVTGNENLLNDYLTGSIFGNGYVLFGWGYTFILAFVVIILFPLSDSLTFKNFQLPSESLYGRYLPLFSPIVLMNFFSWFFKLTSAPKGSESISILVVYLFRGWFQNIFIYLFVFWVTRKVIGIFSYRRR
jgi:hypothetical protein